MNPILEHLNITVSNPERTAAMLVELFDWTIRWEGPSTMGGRTVHVGGPKKGDTYLAVYSFDDKPPQPGSLNHVGILVEELDEVEKRVLNAGYESHSHHDYEPGRRFYFNDHDDIEYEIVSYA